MRIEPTPLSGACVIDIEPHHDERGFFARSYCAAEFEARGLNSEWPQCSVSFNAKRGTLRGMHWQEPPHAETKLVRCTAGAIYDAIVDLRPDSATYLKHFGVELTAENHRQLYIPEGFAHGFFTLADNTEVFYMMGTPYAPGAGKGARYNDPAFGIEWPGEPAVISERDRNYPGFSGGTR